MPAGLTVAGWRDVSCGDPSPTGLVTLSARQVLSRFLVAKNRRAARLVQLLCVLLMLRVHYSERASQAVKLIFALQAGLPVAACCMVLTG